MKKRIALLAGGESAEHQISLLSCRNVLEHIDRAQFDPIVIGISRAGEWMLVEEAAFAALPKDPRTIELPAGSRPLSVDLLAKNIFITDTREALSIDGVFPVLHGPRGEDGVVQGLLTLLGLPFVGAGVLGSGLGMDKDVMKRLLNQAGLRTAAFLVLRRNQTMLPYHEIVASLGSPFFLKPANMGSSVGVHKVTDSDVFEEALMDAFQYDEKVLCESFVKGREVECAILEEEGRLTASLVGEVIPKDFYSYEAKYIDDSGAVLEIPTTLTKDQLEHVQTIAKEVFTVLECRSLGRVDMFLLEDGSLVVNEINTLPGFTGISMYPLLFLESGVTYTELITRLCQSMFLR